MGVRGCWCVVVLAAVASCSFPTAQYRFPPDGLTFDVLDADVGDAGTSDGTVEAGDAASDGSMDGASDGGTCAQTMCGGACVDTSTDVNNCGACGVKCGPGGTCTQGTCACASPLVRAGTSPNFSCVDVQLDSTNCGTPGHACRADQSCHVGTCACRPGLTDTGTSCVDLRSNPDHCGSLTTVCNGLTPTCVDSACVAVTLGCASPRQVCATGSRGGCVTFTNDPLNCGACGHACQTGEACIAGQCEGVRPAVGCTSCPCTALCAQFFPTNVCCANSLGTVDDPNFCVNGTMCPSS